MLVDRDGFTGDGDFLNSANDCAFNPGPGHSEQGVAAFRNTDYASAIELFKQAVQLDPNFTTAELYLATGYSQLFLPGKQTRENLAFADNAIESFKRVLKQDPENTAALLGLAGIYQAANRYQEARDTLLIVSKTNPQNPIPFYSIGAIDWILVFDRNKPLPLGEQSRFGNPQK